MALQFTETAPGVHTAVLINAKTEQRHNIAIIESCNAWQVFVDGELAERDLPSFRAAVSAAERQGLPKRTSHMVRAAGLLVMLSVVGATAVGATKLMTGDDGAIGTNAEVATNSAPIQTAFQRITPVKPSRPVIRTLVTASSSVSAEKPRSDQPNTSTSVETIATTAPSESSVTPKQQPTKTNLDTRRFSSSYNVFGLEPITEKAPDEANEPNVAPIKKVTRSQLTPVEPTPTAATITQPSRTIAPQAAPQPSFIDDAERPDTANNAGADKTPEVDSRPTVVTPVLPTRAPIFKAPVIRSAVAPIEPSKLSAVLGDLNEEADETSYAPAIKSRKRASRGSSKYQPKLRAHSKSKRARNNHRRTKQRATKRYIRRNVRPADRKRVRTVRAHRSMPRQPRMVCFAHTCRFR